GSSRGRTAARGLLPRTTSRAARTRPGRNERRAWSCRDVLRSTSAAWGRGRGRPLPRRPQTLALGQVLSIQVYVEVGSPLGQLGGAVMFRIGIVIIRFGSRIWNG